MGKRWTDGDVNRLKQMAQKHPAPKIAEMMDRTVGGVVFKAHKLKVSLKTSNQQTDRPSIGEAEPADFENRPETR